MTVYAITDTKKGRTGIAPILIFKLPKMLTEICFNENLYSPDNGKGRKQLN